MTSTSTTSTTNTTIMSVCGDGMITSVTSPNAGTVSIFESSPGSPPAGYEFRGRASFITAPTATISDNPIELIFRIHASQLRAGETEHTIQVFRSGELVPPWLGAPSTAVPEPCVGERTLFAGGSVLLRIFATHTSPWSFGYPLCGNGILDGGETCDPPAGECGVGDTCKADCSCAAACDCCASAPATLTISHSPFPDECGTVQNQFGATAFELICNTFYTGGGSNTVSPARLTAARTRRSTRSAPPPDAWPTNCRTRPGSSLPSRFRQRSIRRSTPQQTSPARGR